MMRTAGRNDAGRLLPVIVRFRRIHLDVHIKSYVVVAARDRRAHNSRTVAARSTIRVLPGEHKNGDLVEVYLSPGENLANF